MLPGGGEEQAVDGFDQVVALLVEGVDGVLEAGDGGVGGIGLADLVFLVPEVEIGAVMGEREVEEVRLGDRRVERRRG